MLNSLEAIGKGKNYFHIHLTTDSHIYHYSLQISQNMGKKYLQEVEIISRYPKHQKPLTREDIELFEQ
ncbi:MAG: hypothetical protein F6K22_35040 [Okeania sp. SIO2F4]|uniref:hypothetical protein n=1 Tax=Okeania sp. SIO2F4 TaxID=2607790 RepID=UPI001429B188|nr:hypothetical protein [Okeania sp. SIO2F4]NES07548.1 hypothetical protein [Okeania sp. SIO2F4]